MKVVAIAENCSNVYPISGKVSYGECGRYRCKPTEAGQPNFHDQHHRRR